MTSFGICMTSRDFVCPLCGQLFTRETPDLVLPEYTVCDECLSEFEALDETTRRAQIEQRIVNGEWRMANWET